MNKSIFQIGLPAVFAGFFLLSCNVTDTSTNTTTALEAKSWKLTGTSVSPAIELKGILTTNLNDTLLKGCSGHHILTFSSNTIAHTYDSSACSYLDNDASQSNEVISNWIIDSLTLSISSANLPTNYFVQPIYPSEVNDPLFSPITVLKIQSITDKALILTTWFKDSTTSYTGTETLNFTAQ